MEFDIFASTILYVAVFLLSTCCAYIGQKKNYKFLIILAIIIPTLFAGFRLHSGTDTDTYRTFYNQVGAESFAASMSRIGSGTMEPIIVFLARIGNALHLNASFIFLIFAAITLVFLYLTTRNLSREHAWLYYGMLLFFVFPESFNIMRQLAAISIQAFALSHIIKNTHEGKRINYVGVIFLALLSVGFHYSSLLLLPALCLPFFIKHIRGRTLFVITSIIALICLFAFPQLIRLIGQFGLLPQKHLDTLLATEGSLINVKFYASVILAGVFFANFFRRRDKKDKEYGFLMMLGMIYSAIGFYSGYIGRLSNFFWVFIIIAIVNLINQLFKQERDKMLMNALIAVVYFVLYFVILGFDAIMPYGVAL